MRTSLQPESDSTVHLVFEDYGKFGRAYRETPEDEADRETIIQNIITGQYGKVLRIVAFNTDEGWSRDVTREIAQEVIRRRGTIPNSEELLEAVFAVACGVGNI